MVGSGASFEHEVERCLRGPVERAEPGLLGDLAEPGFACLRAQGCAASDRWRAGTLLAGPGVLVELALVGHDGGEFRSAAGE